MVRHRFGAVVTLALLLAAPAVAQSEQWPSFQPILGPAASRSEVLAELPADIGKPTTSPDAPPALSALAGTWTGWMCRYAACSVRLAVETVRVAGARIVFAVARDAASTWSRLEADWRDGELVGTLEDGARIALRPRADGHLDVLWRGASGTTWSTGVLHRDDSPAGRALTRRETALVPLRIDGKTYRLEMTTYRQPSPGRHPLVVFNHGSTGRDPTLVKKTLDDLGLAAFLLERGWSVAFPMRRGRGNSDGAYDEPYECRETNPLSSGLEHALADLDAVVNHLRGLDWVDPQRMVMGGNSRGGILSLAYAARRPERVKAVLNFVGGWTTDVCSEATGFNADTMAAAGSRYKGPTIWVYGDEDSFYSIAHSRANFEAFRQAGGNGRFLELQPLAPGKGHNLLAHPGWRTAVEGVLAGVSSLR